MLRRVPINKLSSPKSRISAQPSGLPLVFTTATYVDWVNVIFEIVNEPKLLVPLKRNEPLLSVSYAPINVIFTFPLSEPKFVQVEPLYELLRVASRYRIGL